MRKITVVLAGFIVAALAGNAAAQQARASKKSFEVASVKVAAALDPQKMLSGQQRVGMKMDAGRVDIENWSVFELMQSAFKMPISRITGPAWPGIGGILTAQRYEIHATLPSGATKDDVPEMLQSLLAERFKLAYHTEKKEQDVYALVVGKDGLKLQPSPADPEPPADAPKTNRPDPIQISGGNPQTGITIRGAGEAGAMKINMTPDGTIRMQAEKLTMAQLADSVTQYIGRPVVDETGLTGTYQVSFEMTQADVLAVARQMGLQVPGAPGAGPAGGAAEPGGGTSMFRSVEKMGLKLESKKAPVDYMVIDRLEKTPTED